MQNHGFNTSSALLSIVATIQGVVHHDFINVTSLKQLCKTATAPPRHLGYPSASVGVNTTIVSEK